MLHAIFPDAPMDIVKILVSAPIMYVAVVVFIRMSGKRSTSQMNNFDWVVTVALGSLVGSGIILGNVSVVEALFAIGLLLGLQWCLTKLIVHSHFVADLAKAEPRLLVSEGEILRQAACKERISEREIKSAIREAGLTSITDAKWVILETDASLTVMPQRSYNGPYDALSNVPGVSQSN